MSLLTLSRKTGIGFNSFFYKRATPPGSESEKRDNSVGVERL